MREIPVGHGRVTMVDDADYERLSQFKWRAHLGSNGTTWYVRRTVTRTSVAFMHRDITDCPKGMHVDHIDGNGLNNCRSNLRVCTPAQNLRNRGPGPKTSSRSSKYKGVRAQYYQGDRDPGGWVVEVMCDREKYRVARVFRCEEEAARAHDKLAKLVHGEFAKLNFPDHQPRRKSLLSLFGHTTGGISQGRT